MDRLKGKIALITGAGTGVGRACMKLFAAEGAKVVGVSRTKANLDETLAQVKAAGCEGHVVAADLSKPEQAETAITETLKTCGRIDILVNSAGVNLRPHMDALTANVWDQTIAVNLTAPFLLGQRFGPRMAQRGWGRIINIASQQAARAFGRSGGYGASKGGLVSLTRSQSEAWAGRGVCCNAVSPGFVITPLTAEAASDPPRVAAMAARTMIGRNGEAEDFEGIAVFLASRASDYVTGQVICVDGGFSAT